MSNFGLKQAKRNKKDEFYTRMEDVSNEMIHYKVHFKDAIIYCNCDNPKYSNFWRYFHLNFEKLGLKKLLSTHIKLNGVSYLMEYTGGNDADVSSGAITPLKGDGDFRSEECIEVLKQSDIIITNPPFSLFRTFISLMVKYNKKFILIGNINAISYKEVFPLIKEGKVWAGHGFNKAMIFEVGDDYEYDVKETARIADGKKYNRILTGWYTNLNIAKHYEDLPLTKTYKGNELNYLKYDYFDVINVSKVMDIPKDYFGVMAVPITFLGSWNVNQFEIVDLLNRYCFYDSMGVNRFIKENHLHSCNINGKATYVRILIRRKT